MDYIFLSINRFEVKKNIELALEAFGTFLSFYVKIKRTFIAKLRDQLKEDQFKHCFLIIAGGYDKLNSENILYYEKLQQDMLRLDLPEEQVVFVKSPCKWRATQRSIFTKNSIFTHFLPKIPFLLIFCIPG